MKKKRLRKSEMKELLNETIDKFGTELFSKKDKIELIEDEHRIIAINDEPCFFYIDGEILPTLKLLQKNQVMPTVTVDMGAIKFVVGGADIMRPGIVEISKFSQGDFVTVIDQDNKKPLSICKALFDSAEMEQMDKGKVLQNIHYVGDKLWGFHF